MLFGRFFGIIIAHLMPIKGLGGNFQDMKGGLSSISRRSFDLKASWLQRPCPQSTRYHETTQHADGATNAEEEESWIHRSSPNSTGYHEKMQHAGEASNAEVEQEQSYWATMIPELLRDIIQKVDERRSTWPFQIDVIACASVCRAWREATKDVVKSPEISGKLTFPRSVMQPGPRDSLLQCFIKRDRLSSTYHLYLSLTATLGEKGKFLLSARKLRRATGAEYIIYLDAADMYQGSETHVGKLRSNFLGTKFTIYQNLSSECDLSALVSGPNKRLGPRQTIDQSLLRNLDVGHISYELNILGNKGPRCMYCSLHSVPGFAVKEVVSSKDSASPAVDESKDVSGRDTLSPSMLLPRSRSMQRSTDMVSGLEVVEMESHKHAPLVLKSKSPRWHDQLQCWCLNFKGRVTVASVKNFQLVAVTEPSQGFSQADQDKVLLQFGKIGKDIFTMDYRYPLSAFQAFAICLSTFDSKLASE